MVAVSDTRQITQQVRLSLYLWLLSQNLILEVSHLLSDQVRLLYVEVVACPLKSWGVNVKSEFLDVLKIVDSGKCVVDVCSLGSRLVFSLESLSTLGCGAIYCTCW